jgi:hypothetical protein
MKSLLLTGPVLLNKIFSKNHFELGEAPVGFHLRGYLEKLE